MKTAAIIAEYNPYHNGHRYLIERARAGGAERIVCLMSGDFTERGSPAVADRWVRAQMALSDADLVLSFPTRFASAGAEEFASAGVRILSGSGCVGELWFGAECADMDLLGSCAEVLAEEPERYRDLLRGELRNGVSYARARTHALSLFLKDDRISDLLEGPNNILAVEYLKALYQQHSTLKPCAAERIGASHEENRLRGGSAYASSSGIRQSIVEGTDGFYFQNEEDIRRVMPHPASDLLRESVRQNGVLTEDDFSSILADHLWQAGTPEELTCYKEVNEDLGRTVFKNRESYRSFSQFTDLLTSKSLTRSHARRALLHIALGIRKNETMDRASCAQVLAMTPAGSRIVSDWKASGNASEIILNPARDLPRLPDPEHAVMEEDLRVSNLFGQLLAMKSGSTFIPEQRHAIVRDISR